MRYSLHLFVIGFLISATSQLGFAKSKPVLKTRPKAQFVKLIAPGTYKKLSKVHRKHYIEGVQDAVFVFEKKMTPARYAANKVNLRWWIERADALSKDTHCLIGGVGRKLVGGLCPTSGRSKGCESSGLTDPFRCGIAYGGACVDRSLDNEIPQACHAKATIPSDALYARYKGELDSIQEVFCSGDDSSSPQCVDLAIQLRQINGEAEAAAASPLASDDEPVAPFSGEDSEEVSEAPASCPNSLECRPRPFPKFDLDNADFATSFEARSTLCQHNEGKKNEFALVSPDGSGRTFYLNDEGKVCQHIYATIPTTDGLDADVQGILNQKVKSCGGFSTCSDKLGSEISKRLRKIRKTNSVEKSEYCAGIFDRKRCPPKQTAKICSKALTNWNTAKCPGGEAGKKRIRGFTNAKRDMQKWTAASGYKPKDPLTPGDLKICWELFGESSHYCSRSQNREGLKDVVDSRYQIFTKDFIRPEGSDLNEVLMDLEVFSENAPKECSQPIFECRQSLRELSHLSDFPHNGVEKELCGDWSSKPEIVGTKNHGLKSNELVDKDGKVVGRISLRNGKLKIRSSDSSKPSISVEFTQENNKILLHPGSSDSEGLFRGSVVLANQQCPSGGRYCEHKDEFIDMQRKRYVLEKGQKCLASKDFAPKPGSEESTTTR